MSRHDTLPVAHDKPEADPWGLYDLQQSTAPEVEATPARAGLIEKLGRGVASKLEARRNGKLAKRYEQVRGDVGAEVSSFEPGTMDWGNARALERQAASVGAAQGEYDAVKADEAEHAALVAREEARLVSLRQQADRAALDASDAARSFTAKEAAEQAVYVAHLKAQQPGYAARTATAGANYFSQSELAGLQQAHMANNYGQPGLLQQHKAEQARRESGAW